MLRPDLGLPLALDLEARACLDHARQIGRIKKPPRVTEFVGIDAVNIAVTSNGGEFARQKLGEVAASVSFVVRLGGKPRQVLIGAQGVQRFGVSFDDTHNCDTGVVKLRRECFPPVNGDGVRLPFAVEPQPVGKSFDTINAPPARVLKNGGPKPCRLFGACGDAAFNPTGRSGLLPLGGAFGLPCFQRRRLHRLLGVSHVHQRRPVDPGKSRLNVRCCFAGRVLVEPVHVAVFVHGDDLASLQDRGKVADFLGEGGGASALFRLIAADDSERDAFGGKRLFELLGAAAERPCHDDLGGGLAERPGIRLFGLVVGAI